VVSLKSDIYKIILSIINHLPSVTVTMDQLNRGTANVTSAILKNWCTLTHCLDNQSLCKYAAKSVTIFEPAFPPVAMPLILVDKMMRRLINAAKRGNAKETNAAQCGDQREMNLAKCDVPED
jgi:hypothetical protein